MKWLNLPTDTVRAADYVGCTPTARATWVNVLMWSAEQNNGGRIVDARFWTDRQWQQTCGVRRREANTAGPLLSYDGDDLIVWRYPLDKQNEVAAKSAAGRKTAAKRWRSDVASPETVPLSADSSATRSATSSADAEGNRNGKEEECVCVGDGVTHTHDPCSYSIESIQHRFPEVDVHAERKAAERYVAKMRGNGTALDLKWFADVWLPKVGPKLGGGLRTIAAGTPEGPVGWREVVTEVAPDSVYANGGPQGDTPWGQLDSAVRDRISEWCREAAARTAAEVAA